MQGPQYAYNDNTGYHGHAKHAHWADGGGYNGYYAQHAYTPYAAPPPPGYPDGRGYHTGNTGASRHRAQRARTPSPDSMDSRAGPVWIYVNARYRGHRDEDLVLGRSVCVAAERGDAARAVWRRAQRACAALTALSGAGKVLVGRTWARVRTGEFGGRVGDVARAGRCWVFVVDTARGGRGRSRRSRSRSRSRVGLRARSRSRAWRRSLGRW